MKAARRTVLSATLGERLLTVRAGLHIGPGEAMNRLTSLVRQDRFRRAASGHQRERIGVLLGGVVMASLIQRLDHHRGGLRPTDRLGS